MKFIAPLIAVGLLLGSTACRRPGGTGGGEPAGIDPAVERVELERWQLEREREALEWERAELAREREAAAASQAESEERTQAELSEREQELADRELELVSRERMEPAVAPAVVSEPLPEPEPLPEIEPVADYGTFYDDLAPHGDWYDTADYGYVWRPTVVVQTVGWRPYCHGRWVWTNCGWTWLSDEPFGWATYHYGRWTLLAGRGWVWVPGQVWAPAWVCWRMGRDHIGWAPLPPECGDRHRSVWGAGVEHEFGIGADWFNFVRTGHFGGPLAAHCLPVGGNRQLFGSTTNITLIRRNHGRVWVGGPDHRDLCRRLGRELPTYTLETDPVEQSMRVPVIRGDRLRIYAPPVAAAWNPLLRPQRVGEPLGNVQVVRDDGAAAGRWTEQLRADRAEQRRAAEQRFANDGGASNLDQLRREELRRNREQAIAQSARTQSGRVLLEPHRPTRGDPGPAVGRRGVGDVEPPVPPTVAAGGGTATGGQPAVPGATHRQQQQQQATTTRGQVDDAAQQQAGRQLVDDGPDRPRRNLRVPPQPPVDPPALQTVRRSGQATRLEPDVEPHPGTGAGEPQADVVRRQQQERLETVRRQQQEERQREAESARQQQAEEVQRQQQEALRRQHEERQREAEAARRQQAEEAQRRQQAERRAGSDERQNGPGRRGR